MRQIRRRYSASKLAKIFTKRGTQVFSASPGRPRYILEIVRAGLTQVGLNFREGLMPDEVDDGAAYVRPGMRPLSDAELDALIAAEFAAPAKGLENQDDAVISALRSLSVPPCPTAGVGDGVDDAALPVALDELAETTRLFDGLLAPIVEHPESKDTGEQAKPNISQNDKSGTADIAQNDKTGRTRAVRVQGSYSRDGR